MLKKRHKGQTLVEYGFIACLILIASIVIIGQLGKNLNGAMVGLKADLTKHTNAAKK